MRAVVLDKEGPALLALATGDDRLHRRQGFGIEAVAPDLATCDLARWLLRLTHFDPVLTGQATPDWQLVIRLIASALDHLNFEADPPRHATGDDLLFARVLALGEAGNLEVRGAGPGMRDYEVRLPALRSPSCG